MTTPNSTPTAGEPVTPPPEWAVKAAEELSPIVAMWANDPNCTFQKPHQKNIMDAAVIIARHYENRNH